MLNRAVSPLFAAALLVVAAPAAPAVAAPEAKPGKAGLTIEAAAIRGGKLVVTGTARKAGTAIRIEGANAKTKAGKDRTFSLETVQLPPDCIATLVVKGKKQRVAVADCGPEGPRGKRGTAGPQGPQGPQGAPGYPGGELLAAVVDWSGTISRSLKVESVQHVATGQFAVTFTRDVTACYPTAIGRNSKSSVGISPSGTHELLVYIRNVLVAGAPLDDDGFTITVLCPPGS